MHYLLLITSLRSIVVHTSDNLFGDWQIPRKIVSDTTDVNSNPPSIKWCFKQKNDTYVLVKQLSETINVSFIEQSKAAEL